MTEINFTKDNIKFLRQYGKWTQDEFAEKLEITKGQLFTYETRGTPPNAIVLEKLADIAGVDVETFTTIKLTIKMLENWPHDQSKIAAYKADFKNEVLPLSVVSEDTAKYGDPLGVLIAQQNKLIVSLNQQSETANRILQRMADGVEKRVENIDANLTDALGRVDSLKLDVYSGRMVVLQSLARLEKKPVNSLLAEADSIISAYLSEHAQKRGKKKHGGK